MNIDSPLAVELAAVRLVLEHAVSILTYDQRRAISEQINKAFDQPKEGLAAMKQVDSETWSAPYRSAVDRLLAGAEKLSSVQK
jgi:hypothetical protein